VSDIINHVDVDNHAARCDRQKCGPLGWLKRANRGNTSAF
jgi:hypothetical protein